MGWFSLAHLYAALLGLIGVGRRVELDKELEITIVLATFPIRPHFSREKHDR